MMFAPPVTRGACSAAVDIGGYFWRLAGIVGARFWLSCFDFASAAPAALAKSFCFWSRCFDLGDLSPMRTSFDGAAI